MAWRPDTILYHRTDAANVESILRDGLQVRFATGFRCVYLSRDPDMAFMDPATVVLEVDADGLELGGDHDKPDGWQFWSLVDIPPRRIRLKEE